MHSPENILPLYLHPIWIEFGGKFFIILRFSLVNYGFLLSSKLDGDLDNNFVLPGQLFQSVCWVLKLTRLKQSEFKDVIPKDNFACCTAISTKPIFPQSHEQLNTVRYCCPCYFHWVDNVALPATLKMKCITRIMVSGHKAHDYYPAAAPQTLRTWAWS